MNKVTFDYSKASSFIQEHEIDSMKKLAESKKLPAKSKKIPMFFWLSASEAPISGQEPPLSF